MKQIRRLLTAVEREAHASIADDESEWTIYTDSARRTRLLLRIATQWGVTPELLGVGYQFTLPLAALRFAKPRRITAKERARRERLRVALRKGKFGA